MLVTCVCLYIHTIYTYIWRWDMKSPRCVKALEKVTKGNKVGYDRTSSRSPIG